jgi:hypothetical protein
MVLLQVDHSWAVVKKTVVEDEEAPAPKPTKVETKVQEVEDDLDAALDDLGFDD